MISMLACGWAGKPWPGAISSSFHTRSFPQPMRLGSWYSPKEKWWVVSSQPKSKRPRLSLERSSIMGCPSCSAGVWEVADKLQHLLFYLRTRSLARGLWTETGGFRHDGNDSSGEPHGRRAGGKG